MAERTVIGPRGFATYATDEGELRATIRNRDGQVFALIIGPAGRGTFETLIGMLGGYPPPWRRPSRAEKKALVVLYPRPKRARRGRQVRHA